METYKLNTLSSRCSLASPCALTHPNTEHRMNKLRKISKMSTPFIYENVTYRKKQV